MRCVYHATLTAVSFSTQLLMLLLTYCQFAAHAKWTEESQQISLSEALQFGTLVAFFTLFRICLQALMAQSALWFCNVTRAYKTKPRKYLECRFVGRRPYRIPKVFRSRRSRCDQFRFSPSTLFMPSIWCAFAASFAQCPQYQNTSRKGSGKGKVEGKTNVEHDETSFYDEIRNALPDAAIQRMQPQLFVEDWNVPIRFPNDMSAQPGVALVPKAMIAQVLRNIGYTRQPVGILTTQPASQLHLTGYSCREVFIRIQIRTSEGDIKEVTVRRYLTQLGFGAEVTLSTVGDQIAMPETMIKCVAKMPAFFGWTPDAIKGNTVADMLSKRVDIRAVEQIQCTEDGSATFLVHESFVPELLKASGQDAMFLKVHFSCEDKFQFELPDDVSYKQALQYADADPVCGLVVKNAKLKPRYALRFRTVAELQAIAPFMILPPSAGGG